MAIRSYLSQLDSVFQGLNDEVNRIRKQQNIFRKEESRMQDETVAHLNDAMQQIDGAIHSLEQAHTIKQHIIEYNDNER